MATTTKRDIVHQLSNKLGLTQHQASEMVEGFLEAVAGAMCAGDEVAFRTFGTFGVKVTKGKIGRNPSRPDVEVPIPPRCVVRFKPSRELKERVATLSVAELAASKKPRRRSRSLNESDA